MAKFSVEVDVTDAQIKKIIEKEGKFEPYEISLMARTIVENKVKQKMRKAIGNIDDLISEQISAIDWNEVVFNRIKEWAVYDD